MGAFEFTAEELDSLFAEDEQVSPPVEKNETESTANTQTDATSSTETAEEKVENTKAFAKRLSEKTAKAVTETREAVAKEMGFESYEEMIKHKERKVIEDNGLDPESSSKAIDEIVKMRLDNDPRLKELEELRAMKMKEFAKEQLAEVTELTGGAVTDLNQLSKEVVELWKTTGSLKQAYLQVEGENLIRSMRSETSKGSTDHLKTASKGSTTPNNTRTLTDREKAVWKVFYPNMSDEELNKMTVPK